MPILGNETLRGSGLIKAMFAVVTEATSIAGVAQTPEKMVLDRQEATVMLEPYAPNIVRVTLSLRKDDAIAGPGYGIIAHANAGDWKKESGEKGDVLRSSRMVVTVRPSGHWTPTGTAADIAK